jgi:excisionase family DNA binding protein
MGGNDYDSRNLDRKSGQGRSDDNHREISPEGARKALGVSKTRCYSLIRTGELRAVRAGRRILVPVDEIERFLAMGSSSEPDDTG